MLKMIQFNIQRQDLRGKTQRTLTKEIWRLRVAKGADRLELVNSSPPLLS